MFSGIAVICIIWTFNIKIQLPSLFSGIAVICIIWTNIQSDTQNDSSRALL